MLATTRAASTRFSFSGQRTPIRGRRSEFERDITLVETIANGVLRVARVLLFAGETLLLRGGNNKTILDQRRGAVMIKRRDSKNAYPDRSLWFVRIPRLILLKTVCR